MTRPQSHQRHRDQDQRRDPRVISGGSEQEHGGEHRETNEPHHDRHPGVSAHDARSNRATVRTLSVGEVIVNAAESREDQSDARDQTNQNAAEGQHPQAEVLKAQVQCETEVPQARCRD